MMVEEVIFEMDKLLKQELEKRFPWLTDTEDERQGINLRGAWELRAIFTIDELVKWYKELSR